MAKYPRYLPLVSVALFLMACVMPVLTFEKPDGAAGPGETWLGYHALAIGWMGILIGQPGWFANLFWFAGTLFLIPRGGRKILPLILSLIGLLLAMSAMNLTGNEVPADEAGVVRQKVRELHGGLYVWLLAIFVQTATAFYAMIWRRRQMRQQEAAAAETDDATTTATSESESARSMSTGR